MNSGDCPDAAVLSQLLLGRLSEIEAAPLEQHLLGCARCARLAEECRDEDALLRAMRTHAERPIAPADEKARRLIEWLLSGPVFAASEEDAPTLAERRTNSLPVAGSPSPAAGQQPPQVPGYEVLRELGHGGMGVVYLARQVRLNRLVALKMLRSGINAGSESLHRFEIEAETVARLQHPHIVQIHEVGQVEGMPYFCLEYCSAGSLADRLREHPLLPEQAAQVLLNVADAVHAAHQAGIVHRDLKPANILLQMTNDQCPMTNEKSYDPSLVIGHWSLVIPKVTDFGLAKRLDSAEGQTQTGQLLGTPSYMAPEQAAGRSEEIGPAVDVYALGAILYELLTGRPPFKAATILETVDLARQTEPVPVRQLQPRCPRDLETISLKCLQKEPSQRYGSARELAEDLQRFLAGEPIRARPVGWLGRTAKWVKRKPALAALVGVCVLAVVALLGLGFWFSAEMGSARTALQAKEDRARDAERLAQTHEFFGLLRAVEKRSAQGNPGWTWANLDDLARAAGLPPAGQHLAELRSEAACAVGSIDIRQRTVVGEGFPAACSAFHPEGRWLALGQARATAWVLLSVALIEPRSGETARTLIIPADSLTGLSRGGQDGIYSLAFSPDGRWLVAGTRYGALHRWDLTQDPPALASWTGHQKEVAALCFSRSGRALFSASNQEKSVLRWPVADWANPTARLKAESRFTAEATIGSPVIAEATPLAVSPTEGWLACLSSDNRLHFLAEDTLQPLGPPYQGPGSGVQFLPDGNTLVYEKSSQLVFLDLRACQVQRSLSLPENGQKVPYAITDMVLSPDGTLLAASSDQSKHVTLWGVAGGRLLANLYVGDGRVRLAFSPDGRTLAVTAERQTLLYQVGGLREQTFVASTPRPILGCALHPDGRSLACRSFSSFGWPERDITVWPLGENRPPLLAAWYFAAGVADAERNLSFHPRSQLFACTAEGKTTVRDSAGRLKPRLLQSGQDAYLDFGPDGRLWGTVGDELRVWDRDEAPAACWSNRFGQVVTGKSALYTVSAGRRWAAVGGRDGQVHLFQAADVRRVGGVSATETAVRAVAWSGDETLLAAGSDKGELCLLRVSEGACGAAALTVRQALTAHGDRVESLAWLGSRLLVSGSSDRTVKLWHCADGTLRELLTLRQPAPVRWLAVHPDGVRLFLLLGGERAVRVWRLDLLVERLRQLGLGADLEPLQAQPLPAPAPAAELPGPVTETPRGPNGLKAELFAGKEFQHCVKVRYDAQVNWDWGESSPDPLLPADQFSIRWTGWLKAPRPGRYTLKLESDDGSRLWLDGKRLIDLWQKKVTDSPHQVEVELTGQPQSLRVEFFEHAGNASISLCWAQQGGFAMQPVPTECLFHDLAAAKKVDEPAAPSRGEDAARPKP